MSRLSDLINEAKKLNADLGSALESEVRHLQERRSFGLNFERHTPEAVDLYGRPIRKGDKVRMLPPRGGATVLDKRIWIVTGRRSVGEIAVADLRDPKTEDVASHPFDDLVVVAEQDDLIYPGLVSEGKVASGGDQPFHAVLNAENLHALKALLYTNRSAIDTIYIDPPYNTGKSAEWMYGDRYVDANDYYRHSKWLAFMERRLRIAWDLLTDGGSLLISIDDNEVAELRLLCDQLFGRDSFVGCFIWRTDGNIDNQAQVKTNHEYILAYARQADRFRVQGVIDPNVDESSKLFNAEVRNSVVKNGPKNPVSTITLPRGFPADFSEGIVQQRSDRWPHYSKDLVIADGMLAYDVDASSGWANGRLLRNYISQGFAPVVDTKGQETSFVLTRTGAIENIKKREVSSGHVLTVLFNQGTTETASNQLAKMGTEFTYPKPVQLIAYLISVFTPVDGTVLDFFAGSGTTYESVVKLNAETGARRRAILVTDNEVAASKCVSLREAGLRPGDVEWGREGIFESVTKKRVAAVTNGGVAGAEWATYAANVEFFSLTYEAPLKVASHHDFERIAPLLWLRAGAKGRRIESLADGWDVADAYGVIDRLEYLEAFVAAVEESDAVKLAFIVTDDARRFQTACAALPNYVEPVRLYESYLRNFQLEAQRTAR